MNLNTKKVATPATTHANFMGGDSYKVKNPLTNLKMAASSCFFGEPAYYIDGAVAKKTRPSVTVTRKSADRNVYGEFSVTTLSGLLGESLPTSIWSGKTTEELMVTAIDAALDYSLEGTLQLAVYLRNEAFMRTTPQVILVRAANHPGALGTGLIRKYAPSIMKRGDEPSVCVAYQFSAYGKKIPMSLKKALKDVLESFDEYTLSKYRMESRTVKTVDVVNLVHAFSPAIDKLMKGTLSLEDKTWEAIVSKEGSSATSWEKAVEVMPHMALLRNVRNLLEKGVSTDLWASKLVAGAPRGKQLPFRYWTAYREVEAKGALKGSVTALEAIEEAMVLSLKEMPKFSGRVMSLSDNSGSAHGTFTSEFGSTSVSEIGNLTAVITGMLADEGYVGIFGDRLETFPVKKTSSIFDMVTKAKGLGRGVGQSTEHGIYLFWKGAIDRKEHWDHVFVYSDMQAGHGGLYGIGGDKQYLVNGRVFNVPKMIADYRAAVNPNVQVYLVQTAGYQDTLVPEYYNKTYILGGWSASILRFAAEMSSGQPTQVASKQ